MSEPNGNGGGNAARVQVGHTDSQVVLLFNQVRIEMGPELALLVSAEIIRHTVEVQKRRIVLPRSIALPPRPPGT